MLCFSMLVVLSLFKKGLGIFKVSATAAIIPFLPHMTFKKKDIKYFKAHKACITQKYKTKVYFVSFKSSSGNGYLDQIRS